MIHGIITGVYCTKMACFSPQIAHIATKLLSVVNAKYSKVSI